ncbi:MAG: Hsp20/alpha crystallin family protein [Nanobdellota archaeon]
MRRKSLWDELMRMQREMDTMFDSFFGDTRRALPGKGELVENDYREPVADVFETKDDIVATFEIPGVNKEDININATDNGLEISVEKKDEEKKEEGYRRSYMNFYKFVSLPDYADIDNVDATYKNGVLEVKVKKQPEIEQKRKQIEVK